MTRLSLIGNAITQINFLSDIFMSDAMSLAQKELEEGTKLSPRFDAAGLITAVATDADTGAVLMVAHMTAEALQKTIQTGEAHYWSRSRQQLWHKGATSGEIQTVVELRLDCDQDAVWLKVHQQGGGCCHVGFPTCFYRTVIAEGDRSQLKIVESRKK
jgi:phosphoribosyl-AMP cyclohydrolase